MSFEKIGSAGEFCFETLKLLVKSLNFLNMEIYKF